METGGIKPLGAIVMVDIIGHVDRRQLRFVIRQSMIIASLLELIVVFGVDGSGVSQMSCCQTHGEIEAKRPARRVKNSQNTVTELQSTSQKARSSTSSRGSSPFVKQ